MTATLTRELERLTHSGVQLADPAMDVRDRDVYDRDGQAVGSVSDVLVDPDTGEVRLVEVTSNGGVFGLGRKSRLVPVEALTSGDPRTVYVERTREEIAVKRCVLHDQGPFLIHNASSNAAARTAR